MTSIRITLSLSFFTFFAFMINDAMAQTITVWLENSELQSYCGEYCQDFDDRFARVRMPWAFHDGDWTTRTTIEWQRKGMHMPVWFTEHWCVPVKEGIRFRCQFYNVPLHDSIQGFGWYIWPNDLQLWHNSIVKPPRRISIKGVSINFYNWKTNSFQTVLTCPDAPECSMEYIEVPVPTDCVIEAFDFRDNCFLVVSEIEVFSHTWYRENICGQEPECTVFFNPPPPLCKCVVVPSGLPCENIDPADCYDTPEFNNFLNESAILYEYAPFVANAGGPYFFDSTSGLVLDARKSQIGDAVIASYLWDLNGDGKFEIDSGEEPVYQPTIEKLNELGYTPGTSHKIELRMQSTQGFVSNDSTWVSIFEGTGQKDDPYLIVDAFQLNTLDSYLNEQNAWYFPYFRLIKDIDLNDLGNIPFRPIHGYQGFHGVFDGNNHVIKNLRIQSNSYCEEEVGGFFTYVCLPWYWELHLDNIPAIRNLGLIDPSIAIAHASNCDQYTMGRPIGALVGEAEDAIIENCFVEGGEVRIAGGFEAVGGLVGRSHKMFKSTINPVKNCHSTCNVQVEGQGNESTVCYTGGLIGEAESIVSCYSTGKVVDLGFEDRPEASSANERRRAGTRWIGGLAGASKNIINSFSTGDVCGGPFAGGLVGILHWHAQDEIPHEIRNSYATGNVRAYYIGGGLICCCDANFTVANCYATGDVMWHEGRSGMNPSCESPSVYGNIGIPFGGLIGIVSNDHGSCMPRIEHCYAAGKVFHVMIDNSEYCVGAGIVGYAPGKNVGCFGEYGIICEYPSCNAFTCFWDIETTNQERFAPGVYDSVFGSVPGGLTTLEMKKKTTYINAKDCFGNPSGWDFVGESENGTEDIWQIEEGEDYPRIVTTPSISTWKLITNTELTVYEDDGTTPAWIGAMAIDNKGFLYISESKKSLVRVLDQQGNYVRTIGTQGVGQGNFQYPMGIATSSIGLVFIVDSGNNRIQVFNSSGEFLNEWGSRGQANGQFETPYGVVLDRDGGCYVTDTGNDRVQHFDALGRYILSWGGTGTTNGHFDSPIGIAISKNGNVAVVDRMNNRVQVFDSEGTFVYAWGARGFRDSFFFQPLGMAIDTIGNVYVSDIVDQRIQQFDSFGVLLNVWRKYPTRAGAMLMPLLITIDDKDCVWAADALTGEINKLCHPKTSVVRFRRGDANSDGANDISDGVAILNYLFLGGTNVLCKQAGDANDDGLLDISDGIYVLNFLFTGGKPIEPPVGVCGVDPTGHSLPCDSFPPCQ